MGRRWVAWLASVALIAAACGGGDSGDASVADAAQLDSGSGTDAVRTGWPAADDASVVRANDLATTLVDQLGDHETASGAVLLAGDAGYSAIQIEAAIVGANLAADGSITGVQPALEPGGLVAALPDWCRQLDCERAKG